MLFSIICAVLVAAIAFALAITLLRPRGAEVPAAVQDMAVYRTQLAEVEKDRARGVLSDVEAERLKIEISRRLLEADRAVQAAGKEAQAGAQAGAPRALTVAVSGGLVALLAGGSFLLYDQLGAAGMPDEPMASRIAAANESYANRPSQEAAEAQAEAARGPAPQISDESKEALNRARKAVQDQPNDINLLDQLVIAEFQNQNLRESWIAQRRIIAIKRNAATSNDYARLGFLMALAAGDIITADSEAAFAIALEKDPRNALALYYAGLMMIQNGRYDRAFPLWDAALRASPADAFWVDQVVQNIEALAWLAGEQEYTVPMPVPRGPSAAEMAAAEDMSPEARAQMIRGMVENLNARLANEGGTAADWAKLISSLRLIGEEERANAIATEARQKFAQKPEELAQIEAAAETPLGKLESAPAAPSAALPGPSQEQVQAAGEMSAEDRQAMIAGMVDRLVSRLNDTGGSAEEWARAVGVLTKIGKEDEARAMLAKGQAALAGDDAGLATLEAAAKAAGVRP
ncbi:c-type cytochrome biogenesis protein CcmI [Rhodobacter maris]|uniref:Cytochrome c-type biogenesis protein CcmH n=1 Tax=Rhodobacter maris TaxID=446682 RepID=A0A285RYC6_9RHOB|nr:c-type cytochrome biogenesis protein CcmI [Rhodobacter maris]SOB99563.1 cytochrome c-type biogenesis protein CcmH [Rhodobacter maris]